jgi:hypothetical protein
LFFLTRPGVKRLNIHLQCELNRALLTLDPQLQGTQTGHEGAALGRLNDHEKKPSVTGVELHGQKGWAHLTLSGLPPQQSLPKGK